MAKNNKKLLVEGVNDVIVISTLCERHNIWPENETKRFVGQVSPPAFLCKNKKSIDQLLDELDVELAESDLEVMGIVVDADTDLAARWSSLSYRLQQCRYPPLPAIPDPQGTVIHKEGMPVVGIWLMPDNQINGMLENFIAFLIPDDDHLWPYAQECVAKIDEAKRPFTSHVAKANIHTWLAWQEQPGTPLGAAIKYRYLEANAPQALVFIAWIKRLFALEP